MDKWLKYGAVVITILVLIIIGYSWLRGFERSLDRYDTNYSLSREVVMARKPVANPLTKRLMLVVLNEIGGEKTQEMPFLTALRNEGAYRALSFHPPFETKPFYATISSGAWPEINGVLSNSFANQIPTDNIFRRIAEADLSVVAVGHHWWQELNGLYFRPESSFYGESSSSEPISDQLVYSRALDLVQNTPANLYLVDFPEHESAAKIDRFIEGLAGELNWPEDTLIVVTKDGFYAMGNSISSGTYSPTELINLTPTIAALYGICPPTEAHGQILWDALDISPNSRASLARMRSQTLSEFVFAYVQTRGYQKVVRNSLSEAALLLDEAERFSRTAMYEAAFSKAAEAEIILIDTMLNVRRDTVWRGYWLRLPLILLLVAGLVAVVWRADIRRQILWAIGLLTHAVVFWVLYSIAFAQSPNTVFSIGVPSYLALTISFGLIWGLRRVSKQTKLFTLTSQDYWACLIDYLAGLIGVFSWLFLVAVWAFLTIGTKAYWYYPDPLFLKLGTLAITQALYLIPALAVPAVLPRWNSDSIEASLEN